LREMNARSLFLRICRDRLVAATGLILGTVLTMVFVPLVYVTLDDLAKRVKG